MMLDYSTACQIAVFAFMFFFVPSAHRHKIGLIQEAKTVQSAIFADLHAQFGHALM